MDRKESKEDWTKGRAEWAGSCSVQCGMQTQCPTAYRFSKKVENLRMEVHGHNFEMARGRTAKPTRIPRQDEGTKKIK